MRCFKSKRNQVFLSDGLITKRVSRPESAKAEAEFLRELHRAGVRVPGVIEQCGNEIIMEYLPGETLPDFISRMESAPDEAALHSAARRLCLWFEHFYAAVNHPQSGEIRGDVNGRNFIFMDDSVASVDFEGRVYGAMEQDIGKLLAFIHMYNPAQTSIKRRFVRLFKQAAQEKLGLSGAEICTQYRKERVAMRRRRAKISF